MDDYYKVLGLAPNAPQRQIRAKYWLLALNAHPDQAGDNSDTERFARYAEAYKILGNPARRRAYNSQQGITVEPRTLKPGYDLHQRLSVSTADTEKGTVIPLQFVRYDPCSLCWCEGCQRCSYQGLVHTDVEVKVKIPSGLQRSTTLFVEGEGAQTEPGGQRGHLLVFIEILLS